MITKNKENIKMSKNIYKEGKEKEVKDKIMIRIFDKDFNFNYNIYFDKDVFERNTEKITEFIDKLIDNNYNVYSKNFDYETQPNKNFTDFKKHFNTISELFYKVFGKELELKI